MCQERRPSHSLLEEARNVGVLSLLRTIGSCITFWRDFYEDESLHELAAWAFTENVEWFGLPTDSSWRHTIVRGPFSAMSSDPRSQQYLIFIRSSYRSSEQLCSAVGHEMYHRVTLCHNGLRRFVWVDEMMAFLVSQHLLMKKGFNDYAQLRLRVRFESDVIMGIKDLRSARRRRVWLGIKGIAYPEGFGAGVAALGTKVENLVGWEQMCRLVHCKTWEEWLAPLAPGVRQEVSDLLDLS